MCLGVTQLRGRELGHQARIVILWRGLSVVIRSTGHLSLQLGGHAWSGRRWWPGLKVLEEVRGELEGHIGKPVEILGIRYVMPTGDKVGK